MRLLIRPLLLIFVLLCSSHAVAQPKIKLRDNYEKTRIEKVGTLQVGYYNIGNKPLIVDGASIVQAGSVFSFVSPVIPKVILPGDSGYVDIFYSSIYPFEFNCDVKIASNDPQNPIVTKHFRINDSIPPERVRQVRNTQYKGGQIKIDWQPPLPSRDGDPVAEYRVYAWRFLEGTSEFIGATKETTITFTPHGDSNLYCVILTVDDMGNRAYYYDTTWTDKASPTLTIKHIDDKTTLLPTHAAIGSVGLHILADDLHLKYLKASYRDTTTGSPIIPIGEHYGPLEKERGIFKTSWNTITQHGMKEIILYAVDSVNNESTTTYKIQLTQAQGWPRYMPKGSPQPSCALITEDGVGRFVMASSVIADGLFRPNGDIYYQFYPLDVSRSTSDVVIPTSAKFDGQGGYSILVGSKTDTLQSLLPNGRLERIYGRLLPSSRLITAPRSFTYKDVILTGVSPLLIHNGNEEVTVGATQAFKAAGESLTLPVLLADSGVRTFDRFVMGDLNRSGEQLIVRAHDAGPAKGEELAVYDRTGALKTGWPKTVWAPTSTYEGIYPCLGDIDGDNSVEIILPVANDSLYVYHSNGTLAAGFPCYLPTQGTGHNQALIVDANNDGAGDIIYPCKDSIVCINGKTGKLLNGFWPIRRTASGRTMLTAAELNSNGFVQIIEPPDVTEPGKGAWLYVFEPGIKNNQGTIQWGTFQHDMRRTGNYDYLDPNLQNGVEATTETKEVTVYPTATENTLTIQSKEEMSALSIVDMLGRTVSEFNVNGHQSNISIAQLPAGVYLLNVTTAKGVTTERIIKQ